MTARGHFGLLMGAAGGGAWTPANLGTAPFVWLNPAGAVTDAGAGACSQWNDSSGNAYHFIQATGTRRPLIVNSAINGLRALRGDGTADFMRSPIGVRSMFRNVNAGYVFCVFQRVVSTGGGASRLLMFNGNNSGNNTRLSLFCDSAAFPDKLTMQVRRLDADAAASLGGTISVNSGWHMALATMDWATGDGALYVDGTADSTNLALTSSGATSNTPAAVDSAIMASPSPGAFADVEIPEVFAGPYLPTAAEVDKLFGYAAHKYALTSLLPALHPYKTVAP